MFEISEFQKEGTWPKGVNIIVRFLDAKPTVVFAKGSERKRNRPAVARKALRSRVISRRFAKAGGLMAKVCGTARRTYVRGNQESRVCGWAADGCAGASGSATRGLYHEGRSRQATKEDGAHRGELAEARIHSVREGGRVGVVPMGRRGGRAGAEVWGGGVEKWEGCQGLSNPKSGTLICADNR